MGSMVSTATKAIGGVAKQIGSHMGFVKKIPIIGELFKSNETKTPQIIVDVGKKIGSAIQTGKELYRKGKEIGQEIRSGARQVSGIPKKDLIAQAKEKLRERAKQYIEEKLRGLKSRMAGENRG